MTEDDQIQRIERERRKREAALLALLLLLSDQARRFAAYSVRTGNDPIQAIRNVVLGNPQLHLPGAAPVLATAMSEAAEAGFGMAFKIAGETDIPLYSPGLYYRQAANEAADRMFQAMARIVTESIRNAAATQMRTAAIARQVLRDFTRWGWTKYLPSSVEPTSEGSKGFSAIAIATDSILGAYSDGTFFGYTHPKLAEKLTAFRHVSVIDERTSQWCDPKSHRDGLTLPPEHDYWKTGWAPLHARCRSVILGMFKEVDFSVVLPDIPAQAGFGRPPASAFGFRFGNAA